MMPFFAAVLPVMLLFCGLALDAGMLELKQLQVQNAADSAAVAAAMEAERGTGNWVAQGQADAGINGFSNGVNGATVAIVQGPGAGGYAGRFDALQATVTQTVLPIFMGALKGGKSTISAQSAALMTPCIYLTGNGTLQAYRLDVYSGDVDGNTCPVYINAEYTVTSSANMNVEAIDVAGAAGSSNDAGETFPAPTYNVPAVTDPLAAITSPSFSGTCNHTSYSLSSGSATLNPGTYCKGITLTNSTVTLNPGLYVITGGSTWSGATVSGSGVTLYFTSGGGGTDSKFIIQSSSNVSLSAANSSSNGSIPAILVFTDRSWTVTSAQDVALLNSTVQGDGIWYLPATGLYLSNCGTFSGTHYLGIDANNIYSAGTNVVPSNNYSFVTTGNPFRRQGGLVQ